MLPADLTKTTRVPPVSNDLSLDSQKPSSVSLGKEKEMNIAEGKILEEVREGIEVEIAKEVKEAGVKEISESIELPQQLKKETGAIEVGEGVPVSTKPTISLPLDDQKIKLAIKRNKIVDSILWLAHWCLRQIEIAKFRALKLVGVKTKNLSA